ncbi:MAG: hypothetical protein KDD62_07345, partial [Bdellovibrionales bacterium]|nr:hypothetical protein [Bdellovibrionales bacterium]
IRYNAALAARQRALKELLVWQKALAGKLGLLQKLNQKKTSTFGAKRSDLELEGADEQLAQGVIDKIARARLLVNLANNTVERVENLANRTFPGFSTKPYEDALLILERELEFDPDENAEAALTGNKTEDEEYLWAPISSFKPFQTSFNALVDTFNKITKEASESIDEFKQARTEVIRRLGETKTNLSDIQVLVGNVYVFATDEERTTLEAVVTEVCSNLTQELERSVDRATKSPLSSLESIRSLDKRVKEAETCANALVELLENRASRRERTDLLEDAGLELNWLRELAAGAFAALVDTLNSLDSDEPDLSGTAYAEAGKISGTLERVEELSRLLAVERADKERVAFRLKTQREKLSRERGIDAKLLFAESGDDGDHRTPDEALADATSQLKKAHTQLCKGRLEKAAGLIADADASTADAERDIDLWLEVDAGYKDRVLAIEQLANGLKERMSKSRSLFDELTEFDPAVWDFRTGDPSYPHSNGTVEDNLEEVEQALDKRAASLKSASKAYKAGQLLDAGNHLTDAENCNQFISDLNEEIEHKHQSVYQVDQENDAQMSQLLSGLKHQLETPFESSTRQCTIDHLQAAFDELTEAERSQHGELRNPFEIAEVVAHAKAITSSFAIEVQRDQDEYEDAVESAQRAANKLSQLSDLLDRMAGDRDNLPDADAFERADKRYRPLESDLNHCQEALARAHTDWFELDDQIDEIFDEASKLLHALREEKEQGEAALAAISKARTMVRSAKNWSGTYVSSVSGSHGKPALRRADSALEAGDFVKALEEAESAYKSASSAVSSAQSEDDAERRRRQRKREEEERQRRQQLSYSSSYYSSSSSSRSSSSGFGSFSSGGGGGGFGGGFSSGGGGSGW